MTNFEKWCQTVRPEQLADLFSNLNSDACINCPANGFCNVDEYDDMEDPTLAICCRGEFLKWANTESEKR